MMPKIFLLKCLFSFCCFFVAILVCSVISRLQQLTISGDSTGGTARKTRGIFIEKDIQNRNENLLTHRARRRSLIIFGHDRSGTTFISAMFAKDPQIFLVYEPLWITQYWKHYQHLDCLNCELEVVNSIVSCNFSRYSTSRKFLSYVEEPWTGALPVNIFKTPKFCNKSNSMNNELRCPKLRDIPEFVDDVCRTKFKHSVVKVSPVRLPREKIANLVPQVLLENPDVDVRILHLVRDPRGNINSRIDIKWTRDFPNPHLGETARELCSTITENLGYAKTTLKKFNLDYRYKVVLYKQIADDPLGTARDIYKFAEFAMPLETERWIVESTRPNADQLKKELKNPFSPVRNATGNADKWRKDEFFERNQVIEKECRVLMALLGLEKVSEPQTKFSREVKHRKEIQEGTPHMKGVGMLVV